MESRRKYKYTVFHIFRSNWGHRDYDAPHITQMPFLVETLRKRQKNWIDHVLRHESLFVTTEGHRRKVSGKETPGRPRTMLLDVMMQEDEESEIDCAKLKEKVYDRETWRHWERTCLRAENTGPDDTDGRNIIEMAYRVGNQNRTYSCCICATKLIRRQKNNGTQWAAAVVGQCTIHNGCQNV